MDPSFAQFIGWSEATKGSVPPPLTGPSITVSPLPAPHPPTVFLFGGKFVQSRRLTADMWAMDLATKVWERVETGDGPGPRYFHSMDIWQEMLVCFGGMSDSDPVSVHNDIWFFDCASRSWLPQPQPTASLSLGKLNDAQDPSLAPSSRYAHLSAVSRGQLVISGGQHSDNSWIYEINVYDLEEKTWVSKTHQPELQGLHSKGAYRSVSTSSNQRVITPAKGEDGTASSAHSYSIDEVGGGGDIWTYSNYDFAKVRRELDLMSPFDGSQEAPPTSAEYQLPPSFTIRDQSGNMHGSSQPPGLRFPTGGIVGNHLLLCGLYLASSSAAFSIWALNLDTMVWRHLEPQVLASGSWNRAILWPEAAKILVFGNAAYDLAADYGRRAVNCDHLAIISLEAFGIYQPPNFALPHPVQGVGLMMLDEKLASDYEVVCDDGRRIKCSRRILAERWPWFAEQDRLVAEQSVDIITEDSSIDIGDTLLGSFKPADVHSTHLRLPEPFPVCVALVQYFYTLSLATPLQNRAPVLSALLFLAKQYDIQRLARLVVHALHERLEPAIALGVYEIATLCGEQNLQVRAMSMLHTARGGSSSRFNKHGPLPVLAGQINLSPQTSSSPYGISTSSESSAPSNLTSSLPDNVPYRRARVESFTVPEDVLRPCSIIEPPFRPLRHPARVPIAIGPPQSALPPVPDTPGLSAHSGRSSSSSSSDVSRYLATPEEATRESCILPPSVFLSSLEQRIPGVKDTSRSLTAIDKRLANRSFRSYGTSSLSNLEEQFCLEPSLIPTTVGLVQTPPSAPSASQAQLIQQLAEYSIHNEASLNQSPSRNQAYCHPFSHADLRRSSIATISSVGTRDDHKQDVIELPSARTSHEYMVQLCASGGEATSAFTLSSSDTMSIQTAGSNQSDRKALKADRQAFKQAEKEAKRIEEQSKFDRLKLETLQKRFEARANYDALQSEKGRQLAIFKAEAQKKAELAAGDKAQEAIRRQPKSRLGRFGAKFADAVLFPSTGSENSMF